MGETQVGVVLSLYSIYYTTCYRLGKTLPTLEKHEGIELYRYIVGTARDR